MCHYHTFLFKFVNLWFITSGLKFHIGNENKYTLSSDSGPKISIFIEQSDGIRLSIRSHLLNSKIWYHNLYPQNTKNNGLHIRLKFTCLYGQVGFTFNNTNAFM